MGKFVGYNVSDFMPCRAVTFSCVVNMSSSSAEKRLSEAFEQSARKSADAAAAKFDRELEWVKFRIDAVGRIVPDNPHQVEFIRTLTSAGVLLDPDDITPSNPTVLSVLRKMALQVSDAETDKPIKTAFRKAGLDEKNPLHWRILIWMFARAHFGPTPKLGARRVWTADKYCDLLSDFAQVKSRNRQLGVSGVCRQLLKKRLYGRGKKPLTVERLRKAYAEARNPKYNVFIATQLVEKLLQLQTQYSLAGKDGTPRIAGQHERELTESIIKWIEANWREYVAKGIK